MNLVCLRIRGFRRFAGLELDLDHPRLLVLGGNEAGKTTLMEALLAGLYGLAPQRRGAGHAAALRDVQPWGGAPAGLALSVRLSPPGSGSAGGPPADGHLVEIDWDFSGERTRVIDHQTGESISPDFATGTHGWRDVGAGLVGLPGSVFRQLTCVGEGELARIVDPMEIRNSLLRIAESGVDEMVEAALRRLEDAALQASVPRVNSRTRRNALGAELRAAQAELDQVRQGRLALDQEIEAIAEMEARLAETESLVAELRAAAETEAAARRAAEEAERARREAAAAAEQRRLQAQARAASLAAAREKAARLQDRAARTREIAAAIDAEAAALAEAERTESPAAPERVWTAAEIDAARRLLASPIPPEPAPPPLSRAGLAATAIGALAAVIGLSARIWPAAIAGFVLAFAGVLLLTRRPIRAPEPLRVGDMSFPDHAALLAELDRQRTFAQAQDRLRALQSRRRTLDDRRALLASLLEGRAQADWDREAQVAVVAAEAAETGAGPAAAAGSATPGPDREAPAAGLSVRSAVGEASIEPPPGPAVHGSPSAGWLAGEASIEPPAEPPVPGAGAGASAERAAAGLASASGRPAATRLAEAEAHARRLREAMLQARASLERGSRSVPEVAPLEERVADLEARISALEELGAATSLAAATLREESVALRRAYAPRLQELLSRDLARVTAGRYVEALVSDEFRVQLRAPETGALVELERLSRGTQQQVYLLLRLAVLEIVGGSEPLPLFLDDALALGDDARRAELLRVIEEQPRQVIYLAASAVAAESFGPEWRRIELPAL